MRQTTPMMTHAEAFRRYDGAKTPYRWRGGKVTTLPDAPDGIWYLVGQSRRLSRVRLSRLAARMERQAQRLDR